MGEMEQPRVQVEVLPLDTLGVGALLPLQQDGGGCSVSLSLGKEGEAVLS